MKEDERRQFISGLREMADFFEDRPELPIPWATFNAHVRTAEELKKAYELIGGKVEKGVVDSWFFLIKRFSPTVRYEVNIPRDQVCERTVVGKKTIPAMPEHEIDVVEWKCGSLLEEGGDQP